MQEDSQINKPNPKYCCPTKQYYTNDACHFGKDLKILPRVVIYKKSLKVNNTYESIINVRNQGLYKRHLIYSTDSSDTTVRTTPIELANNFLEPDHSLQISVHINPHTKSRINRRRHVFITSLHPNITFSVPIIIISNADDKDISLPSCLTFPSTAVENFTYYEMVAYNSSMKKLPFNIKCPLSNLTVHAKSFTIKGKDYGKILLKLYCKDANVVDNCLKFKFNTADSTDVPFKHEPLQCNLYLGTLNINFECVRFQRRRTEEFSICNESNTDIVFDVKLVSSEETPPDDCAETTASNRETSLCDSNQTEMQVRDKFSYRHFAFTPDCGTVKVNSRFLVKVFFCPVMHDDFLSNDDFSPIQVLSSISISWKNDMKIETRNISLSGHVMGPDIEILPAILDLRHVYFGEEHCAPISVLNKDDICDAHVDLVDLPNGNSFRIVATPKEGVTLKPNQKDVFQIKFYYTEIGRFLIKLEFKVKYGAKYSMIIKGCCVEACVKCFPNILKLGVIPIAIPQKRLVLLMNPLTIPITLQCTVKEDGSETPLVLNTHNTEEHLPITVKDPYNYLKESHNQERDREDFQISEEFEVRYGFEEQDDSLLSVHSQIESTSSLNSEFERSVLDLIPDMSYKLVSYLKTNKILDKSETEKRVIDEVFNALLNTPYFFNMDKYKNYTQMDWNSLATDPQEIYCNTEIIYLKPNTYKAISIVLIPNVIGWHSKYIELRVCPVMQPASKDIECIETPELCQIIDSKFMTSELRIEYNCSVPEIKWDNIIIMDDQLYAGEYYDFEMVFQNISHFGGFFYYDVVPESSAGKMKFLNNTWKYFIEPDSVIHVPCQVKFTKLGSITLSGIVKFVGIYASYPFHIKSQVLPPKLNVSPHSICKNLTVLEVLKLHIFIKNATPTTTWFKLKLKDESGMSVEPCGGQLAPNGQIMYVTLKAWFQDPGTYKNSLYFITEFETAEKTPITINVKGIPIFLEPEVRAKDLNAGYVLCTTEEDFYEDKPNFSKVIKVINKGLRYYRICITRTKCSTKNSCSTSTSIKAKTIIKPNNLIVPALSETSFSILISCCEATQVYNEFRIQLIDLNDVKHMESYRFSLLVTFIMPQLSWNRHDITINYYRTHKYQAHEQWESIKLTNITQTNVSNINLKISGPFKIKELFEDEYENILHFPMAELETKEFLITFNKDVIRNSLNISYEGYITCHANFRQQKSVRIKLLLFVPKISIKQNQVTLFTKQAEGEAYIELTNTGDIPAAYKWKKIKEEWNYISQKDDTKQVASVILSDLIRMVELETTKPQLDSETNMTRRYQKYKCFLKDLHDSINVKEILYEVIDSLDLEAKRYKLSYQDTLLTEDSLGEEAQQARYPVDHIQPQIEGSVEIEVTDLSEHTEVNTTNDGYHLKPQTVYLNPKFVPHSSDAAVIAEKLSNAESCVHYTLKSILSNLKLEDSYDDISLPSSETCELKNSVYFLEKVGLLQQKQSHMCVLHIPPIRKGFEVQATFQLVVVGGKSQQLEITLVNLDETITIDKQHIYLGRKPWYERFQTKSYIENITNYQISLTLNQVATNLKYKLPKVAVGFINILGSRTLQLFPSENAIVGTEGLMGFNEDFKRKISIIVNDSEEKTLEFSGHGAMPILIMPKPTLPFMDQHPDEIIEEYLLLQKLYYFEIFKAITEKDDEYFGVMQEEEENDLQRMQSFFTDMNLSSSGSQSGRSSLGIKREQNFLKLMRTYVLVNNNADLPNSTVLDQLLQTEKFLNYLSYSSETSELLRSLYQNYLQQLKCYDDKARTNLKHFNVQPLPFHSRVYVLDMGNVYLNQFCKFLVTVEFIGPGKLIAAARTAIKIPGLVVDFQISGNDKINNFIYYNADVQYTPCDESYRNVNERALDRETNPKVKHAHSYDFNYHQQHQRTITIKDKCYKNYYNSLNKSIYLEQKDHFTHCKLAAKSKYTFSSAAINVTILFRPQKPFFQHNQHVEDYLFIDLHMGATLPILLRALVIDRKRKDNS